MITSSATRIDGTRGMMAGFRAAAAISSRIFLLSVVFLVGTASAFAQPPQDRAPAPAHPPPPSEGPPPEILETIRTVKQMRLVEELNLDTETASAIASTLAEYDQLRIEARRNEREFSERLRTELQKSEVDEDRLTKILDAHRDAERTYQETKRQLESELREVFTPRQYAKWLLFEKHFAKRLKRVIHRLQKRPPSPRGPDGHRRGTRHERPAPPP